MSNRFGIGVRFLALGVIVWAIGDVFFFIGNRLAETFGFHKDWVANVAVFIAIGCAGIWIWRVHKNEKPKI